MAAVVHAAAARLIAAGIPADEAQRDAGVLARHVLGWDLTRWLTERSSAAPPAFDRALDLLIARRAAREPLAYITGAREFFGRVFRVASGVLIPRPETELLVEEALHILDARPRADRPPLVVDVGTGSGCIAISIALERPGTRVVATDVSTEALGIARENARRLGAAEQVEFREASLIGSLPAPPDAIVSNPPYVGASDRPNLPLDVRGYEPDSALFAGIDGLDVIRELLPAAAAVLPAGGALALEVGRGQAPLVSRLISETPGLRLERIRLDLQSIPRVVVARKAVDR